MAPKIPVRDPTTGRWAKAPRKSWLAITAEVLASRAVTIVGMAAIMLVGFAAAFPDRPPEVVRVSQPVSPPHHASAPLQWPDTVTCFVGYKRIPC